MKRVQILIPDTLKKPMGGMGVQCENIIKYFPDMDYHFDILGTGYQEREDSGNWSYYPIETTKLPYLDSNKFWIPLLMQSGIVMEGMRVAYEEGKKPDVIHAFDWSTFVPGVQLSKHFGIPLVVTIQLSFTHMIDAIGRDSMDPIMLDFQKIPSSMETYGMLRADRIIQVSPSYANLFPSIYKPKTCIIPNGINLEEWKKESDVELPGNRKHKVVYIGRFAFMKGIHNLLNAKIPDDMDLIFIGGPRGSDNNLFDAMELKCRLEDNLHYVGYKSGQEKVDWLFAADAMIVPSIHEPFGIVALEALASKNILLSSFVNGMGDFLNEDIAINCGTSSEDLSNSFKKLCLVLDNKEEKEKRIGLGLDLCQEYHWMHGSSKLHSCYEGVL